MKIGNILKEYRAAIKRQNPDTAATVRVIKKHGWQTYPTGKRLYVVTLALSGNGYRDSKAHLYIDTLGVWYVD